MIDILPGRQPRAIRLGTGRALRESQRGRCRSCMGRARDAPAQQRVPGARGIRVPVITLQRPRGGRASATVQPWRRAGRCYKATEIGE